VIIRQILSGIDDSVHICFHQVGDDVDVFEPCRSRWFQNVHHSDNVLVVEKLKQFNFPDNSLCIDEVLKCFRYLLDSNFCLDRVVKCGAYDTIGSMSDLFDILVLFWDKECRTCALKLSHTLWKLGLHRFTNFILVLRLPLLTLRIRLFLLLRFRLLHSYNSLLFQNMVKYF